MKPLLFRFKITGLAVLASGIVLAGFGFFFLESISRVGMARIDQEIRSLGEGQLHDDHPLRHWQNFEKSLEYIYGADRAERIAVMIRDNRNQTLFSSNNWPAELAQIRTPELTFRTPPALDTGLPPHLGSSPKGAPPDTPGEEFIQRLDRDGDLRVSPEEFDGPPHRFNAHDRNSDGYITLKEAPRLPPGPRGFPLKPPRRRRVPEQQKRIKAPVFQTHETSAGQWRIGFMGNQFFTLVIAANLTELHRETAFFRKMFLIATPFALLALACGGWILASRALRPVAVITRTAEKITAQGLDRRIPIASADMELGRLVDVINRMLDRLERSFHQAMRFGADAAHELLTPLTVLQGELDNAIQNARAGSKEQQRYSTLLEEVRGLKAVVRKLLLLARADVGQLPLGLESVNVSRLVESAVEDVEIMAPHLTVRADIAENVSVTADPDLIGQVIRNMTTNAVKYNRQDGIVQFCIGVDARTVRFTVANTGPGIPEKDRSRIFDRFYRVDKARGRNTHSAGLGLSLAREIARAHDGDLVLLPDQKDGMIVFKLTLPQAPLQKNKIDQADIIRDKDKNGVAACNRSDCTF